MKKLLKYLKNYKKELVFGPFFKLLEAVFELIVPMVMAKMIDNGIGNNNENKIVKKMSMGNGYMADVTIGYFHYTYSLYANACNYWFEDANKTIIYSSKNLPFRVFSRNE